MGDLTIRTNNRPRDVLNWYDLTAKESAEFDYLDTLERQSEATFVRYKGWVYDLGEFMPASDDMKPWQGHHAESYFSGVLIRYTPGAYGEAVIMGNYYS